MKKELILLGTFHLEQDVEIVTNKEHEIVELVDYLAEFKPSTIALEWDKFQNEELNEDYINLNGHYLMNEIQQIGFRLGKKLQHKRVYAVNWGGQLTHKDMMYFHKTIQLCYPGIQDKINLLNEITPKINNEVKLINSYERLNNREYIEELEKLYLSFVEVNDENGKMIGFNFINKWFERELMIFKNIVETIPLHSDIRVFLLIGNDHLWMLTKLFEGYGWTVINPFSK